MAYREVLHFDVFLFLFLFFARGQSGQSLNSNDGGGMR